ncbi:dTDP-4-amino-4,6-dideoxygalactose transaminase [Meinhardsimonia xiamenensis]|jgi:dTDP-4-amino-4,6-dideoxygalactose transaminase|uniref:dTDP-4-amino-4,6-dideoxygalactose transaminase n=1 Tax=Meinhardsimonia xiamenensis TaxID=990712 RepID=A0A1G9HJL8_9RHOB|nr:DegT/DnrJ/EryC1/StrS aminotransferase family protein [Meinhardsimonia xiamenensis]PRX27668.1 dTDP-4-amino-4,6-dideoxygalactose transaminase [Meinhardsimonia xiamenensis]SDL13119.1 dTDP-4-amino-4,6-dideoxygalactose transaminase [Meinhardsimonia xiamenensis]
MTIAFIDLAAQQARIRERIEARIRAVLDHGNYIMGPEVAELEEKLGEFCGARHVITCANGTDALELALMALGVGEGDAVFVPSFTFAATAEVVPGTGATPVFVEVDPATFNMDPESLKRAIAHARGLGLRPAVVIPVDLFGLPADYDAITPIARAEGMRVIADSAQGFGASYKGRMTGTLADITTTSFFPAKPLGCYGDGGALFTDDDELAALMRSLRVHGKGTDKYDNVRIGRNSRLDTIQAAILLEKLVIYPDEIEGRQRVAETYSRALEGCFRVPHVPEGCRSVWAQYTLVATDAAERDAVMAHLKAQGVPSVVYYPRPLHRQTAYADFPTDPAGLTTSEALAETVFSLPMHPYIEEGDQKGIISVCLSEILKSPDHWMLL